MLAGDKFMPEMHLSQSRFTWSACRPFTKNKENIQKFKAIGDSGHIYQIKLDKACCQHDMAYGDFKDLPRTASDKSLHGLTSMVYNFFNKKAKDIDTSVTCCTMDMLLVILTVQKVLKRFMKKNCKKQIKLSLALKK